MRSRILDASHLGSKTHEKYPVSIGGTRLQSCSVIHGGVFLLAACLSHSHGVHSLYCDSCPVVGVQEVPGAVPLSHHFTYNEHILAQKSSPGDGNK